MRERPGCKVAKTQSIAMPTKESAGAETCGNYGIGRRLRCSAYRDFAESLRLCVFAFNYSQLFFPKLPTRQPTFVPLFLLLLTAFHLIRLFK